MESDGYLVLPGFLNPESLWKKVEPFRYRTDSIFNGQGKNDHKRKQTSLPNRVIQELLSEVQTLPFLLGCHVVKDFVLLRSLPGCTRQAAHTDYIPDTALLQCESEKLPLLFLYALEDDTRLVVWPGSHKVVQGRGRSKEPILPKVITIDAGDAILFRPDVVHAGAEYETENVRIHCYIDSTLVKRDPNRTWIIAKHADELVREKILE
jgi:ectoine hydroxylase-related dioxygenase (phytanoyl-CoA dioxygenase family)